MATRFLVQGFGKKTDFTDGKCWYWTPPMQ